MYQVTTNKADVAPVKAGEGLIALFDFNFKRDRSQAMFTQSRGIFRLLDVPLPPGQLIVRGEEVRDDFDKDLTSIIAEICKKAGVKPLGISIPDEKSERMYFCFIVTDPKRKSEEHHALNLIPLTIKRDDEGKWKSEVPKMLEAYFALREVQGSKFAIGEVSHQSTPAGGFMDISFQPVANLCTEKAFRVRVPPSGRQADWRKELQDAVLKTLGGGGS